MKSWHVSLALALVHASVVFAQGSVLTPQQPQDAGSPGAFKIVGNSLVSAQQLFLGTEDQVYFIDKAEANPATVGGHSAWMSEYSLSSNMARTMELTTNAFCAGGGVLGNGTWVNVGGGVEAVSESAVAGGSSLRLLTPCDDGSCEWHITANLSTERRYPTVETLEDGTLLIMGGCKSCDFINNANSANPTYEIFPSLPALGPDGAYSPSLSIANPVFSPFLNSTLPANLYPLTFLLPSGRLLVQANRKTAIIDHRAGTEELLGDVPDAVRTYPASASVVLLPLTPRNRWEATIMFCGGSNISDDEWTNNLAQAPASKSCVQITPDVSGQYDHTDSLPEGRTMGNLILLPTGQVMLLNGANSGIAGIGNASWAVGQSYADHPILEPLLFDPEAPKGQRWSRANLSASTVPRMYPSSATLLPDGAILVAGSNPNFDYTNSPSVPYETEYRIEKLYPSYFDRRRPEPHGLPTVLTYGGSWFDVELSPDDYFHDPKHTKGAKVVVMRTGFSTHAQNMGQRLIELENTVSIDGGGVAVLHVAQVPPNPAAFPPGPAFLFVVVDGVPSIGVMVTVGSGRLGPQELSAPATLPPGVGANLVTNAKASAGHKPRDFERVVGMCVAGVLGALLA
ncbi:glyoxal oxidase N-terminus-domain-containing protein [Vararia minispora EC-137]|uniref:Glyoxal oxidase N-terminus-domain-containing protein n=1 Tax=Vararia minispora EC-137 TaxID=1314806 RepID=A0ACB8QDL8_9AGAM|nr:glyoxal oxidase N-terminus-domain-containing protein [Vararia minispora EC-137]